MNTEILDKLKNVQLFYQNSARKKEPEQLTLLPELAKSKLVESFNRKLALTISETGALDYGNCELKNIINSFIETFVQENTIDAQLKRKDKELEEKIVKIEQSVKSGQGMELPIPQEESLTLKESNVIKDKEVSQESGKGEIKTNYKQISMLDKENLQRNDILARFKCKPMKEQDRETSKTKSKAIKISKENPYMNNGSASIILKEKTQELDIDEIKNLLLNITSRLDSIKRSQMSIPSRS
ncbi:8782_t:CDS:2 [Gigaspora margarita]|uniref:8782_t:CDS:1 n=1 Tax=Gigaspora margarita TaxID=4874 RepID=A0ABN7USQ6_GIGMA|nr:8782_t:CDS:2 [Gigaspora margarita]